MTTTMTSVHVVHTSECPDIGPICSERNEPPQLHDQRFAIAELRVTAAYGLWRWLGVQLELPLKLNHTTIEYERLDGTPFSPDYPPIHHRNETLFGLGDPVVTARAERSFGSFAVTGRLGVSIPVGETEPNPFALGDMGLPHQHIQFGAGSFAPLAAVTARFVPAPEWRVFGHGRAHMFVAENEHGYRPGNRFSLGMAAQRALGPVAVIAGADVAIERSERWDGEVLQDGNLGRTDVLAGLGVRYAIAGIQLGLGVKVPVYQHIVTAGDEHGQLSYPAIVDVTVERRFDLR